VYFFGGNKVFWVDQRVGLKVARKHFGIGGRGGSDEAHRRFFFSIFDHFYVLRRWLRVGLGGGSGGNKVFWVNQRVGLKAS
jgi:hypothetical protein